MEKIIDDYNQNNQEIEQNFVIQSVQISKSSRIKYSKHPIVIGMVLVVLLAIMLSTVYFRKNNPTHTVIPAQITAPNSSNIPTPVESELLTENEFNTIFVFNQNENASWAEEEKTEVKNLLSVFYPVVRDIYGERFNTTQQLQLNKLDPMTNETSYASVPNGMFLLFPLSKSTLIHELVHLFHYPNARLNSTYEEGFARAVEIEGLKNIYGTAERDFNYGDAIVYDLYRTQALANGMGSINSGSADIQAERYSLAAFAFSKAYYEDPYFFKKFNDEVYKRVKNNTFSTEDLGEIFEKVKPTVENIPTDIWISQQGLLNYKNAKIGLNILISGFYDANNFQLIERFEGGYEVDRGRETTGVVSTTPVELQYFDYNDKLIDSQSIFLSYAGRNTGVKKKETLDQPGYYAPKFPPNYFGYYTVKARTANSGETYESTSYGLYPYIAETKGITGIVPGIISGSVSVFDAEGNKITEAEITGGTFYADVVNRGTYKLVVNNEDRVRYVTKDNSPVVVLVQ